MSRKGLGCCLTLGVLAAASAARAVAPPSDSTDRLTIAVRGHISAKCTVEEDGSSNASFGPIADMKTGVAAAATLNLPFSMSCNAPYTATLVSKNGGLAFTGRKTAGFSDLVTYSAHLGLMGEAGGGSIDCDSQAMASSGRSAADVPSSKCSSASDRQTYSAGRGEVKLTVRGGGLPLLAGVYADQLTLLLSPSVSGGQG